MTLVEIIGSGAESARDVYGVVMYDRSRMNGWAVVALEGARDTVPELRFYPRGGLTRVASAADAFELQLSPNAVDGKRQARLVAAIHDAMPELARHVAEARAIEAPVDEVLEVDDEDLIEPREADTAEFRTVGFLRTVFAAPLALARRLLARGGARRDATDDALDSEEPESSEQVEPVSSATIQERVSFPAPAVRPSRPKGPVSVELLAVAAPPLTSSRPSSARRPTVAGRRLQHGS